MPSGCQQRADTDTKTMAEKKSSNSLSLFTGLLRALSLLRRAKGAPAPPPIPGCSAPRPLGAKAPLWGHNLKCKGELGCKPPGPGGALARLHPRSQDSSLPAPGTHRGRGGHLLRHHLQRVHHGDVAQALGDGQGGVSILQGEGGEAAGRARGRGAQRRRVPGAKSGCEARGPDKRSPGASPRNLPLQRLRLQSPARVPIATPLACSCEQPEFCTGCF